MNMIFSADFIIKRKYSMSTAQTPQILAKMPLSVNSTVKDIKNTFVILDSR